MDNQQYSNDIAISYDTCGDHDNIKLGESTCKCLNYVNIPTKIKFGDKTFV